MLDWPEMVDRTLKHEGGYVFSPSDPGGQTNFGISKRAYPSVDIQNLTREGAIEIYRRDYFAGPGFDKLHPAIGFQVFDAGVNCGVLRSVKWLQQVVGVEQDGVLGNATLAAVANMPVSAVVFGVIAARGKFYTDSPLWGAFGKGWVARVFENMAYASSDLASIPPVVA